MLLRFIRLLFSEGGRERGRVRVRVSEDQEMSAGRQDGTVRRKHKGPGTEMGEELYHESFDIWMPQFPYL